MFLFVDLVCEYAVVDERFDAFFGGRVEDVVMESVIVVVVDCVGISFVCEEEFEGVIIPSVKDGGSFMCVAGVGVGFVSEEQLYGFRSLPFASDVERRDAVGSGGVEGFVGILAVVEQKLEGWVCKVVAG